VQASEYYSGEDQTSSANKCLEKVALISGQLERYAEAVSIFKQLGVSSMESNLLKFNAKKYFQQAALCHLARKDAVGARADMEEFKTIDYTFGDSREAQFVEKLIEACSQYDVEAFTDAVYEYDKVSKLDPWKTTILLRIKTGVSGESPEGEGDGSDEDVDLT